MINYTHEELHIKINECYGLENSFINYKYLFPVSVNFSISESKIHCGDSCIDKHFINEFITYNLNIVFFLVFFIIIYLELKRGEND